MTPDRPSPAGPAAPAPAGSGSATRFRPHPLFVVLRSWPEITAVAAAGLTLAWLAGRYDLREFGLAVGRERVALITAAALALRLGWNTLEWLARRYSIEAGLVRWRGGVLSRFGDDIALARVQHTRLDKPLVQRLFGLGTIGFSAAGTGSVEVVWFMVSRPEQRLASARAAIDAASPAPAPEKAAPGTTP